MRKIIILALSIIFIGTLVYAETFSPVTKDNEVENIEQVKIKGAKKIDSEVIYTLSDIDAELALIGKNIEKYQAQIAEWEDRQSFLLDLRIYIEEEAKKIKLKEKEGVE